MGLRRSTEELGAAGSHTSMGWTDRPPGATSGREEYSGSSAVFLGADHKASLGGWDATGAVHRKKMMMMMMVMTIMPPSKPLQGLWGNRQGLAGDGSSRQAGRKAGGQKWQQVWPQISFLLPFNATQCASPTQASPSGRFPAQPGTHPYLCRRWGEDVTADFLMVALEIRLQKGCFSFLPIIFFFCMFECFQEDLG